MTIGRVTSAQHFEQAVRRDPDELERARVVQIPEAGCAGFVLETTSSKVVIATANHCTGFDLAGWCKLTNTTFASDGTAVPCKAPIVADRTFDFAVFEAEMTHATSGETTLVLADYTPPEGTRLRTTGFPTDMERSEKITTTENCWLLGVSRDLEIDPDTAEARTMSFALRHNCTSFVGNSGGPTWVEGTRDVIGVGSGAIDEPTISPSNDLGSGAVSGPSANFVTLHRAELRAAGVVIASAPPQPRVVVDAGRASTDAGNPSVAPPPEEEDEGCAAAHSTTTNGGVALLALVAIAVLLRRVNPRASR